MNKLLKTLLCTMLCMAAALPSFAEIEIIKDDGIITAIENDKLFFSDEMLNTQADKARRESDWGISADGQSAVIFVLSTAVFTQLDGVAVYFAFVAPERWNSSIERNNPIHVGFRDGNSLKMGITAQTEENGLLTVGCILGAKDGSNIPSRLPMNEAMVQLATSDIASLTCGGQTYHFRGNTAQVIRSEFDALFKQKGVPKDAFSIYLNSVDAGASSAVSSMSGKSSSSKASKRSKTSASASGSSSSAAPAVPASKPSARASEYSSDIAALIKNPAGFSSRNPFTSPGIYEENFKSYASGNSWRFRTRQAGPSRVLVFDNGTVSSALMGYECKFVANFKNQILNGYAYQSQVISREQAMNLAEELASGLEDMPNIAPSASGKSDSGAIFSRQYLYGAGATVTVDARQIDGRYFVSLSVGITHF